MRFHWFGVVALCASSMLICHSASHAQDQPIVWQEGKTSRKASELAPNKPTPQVGYDEIVVESKVSPPNLNITPRRNAHQGAVKLSFTDLPQDAKESELKKPDQGISQLLLGRDAFSNNCLECHDAQKSMSQNSSYDDWLKTIDEMSRKEGANIPKSSFVAIATYLRLVAGTGIASSTDAKDNSTSSKDPKATENSAVNSAQAAQGRGLFNESCTSCHDAEKSTSKSKSVAEWRSTIQRMSAKEGANIPSSSIDPIAAYLASLTGNGSTDASGKSKANETTTSSGMSVSGTISPTWRGGNGELQNGGFFPDAWLGVNWNTGKELSGRINACVTCHAVGDGQGDRFELVEAALRYDLVSLFDRCQRNDTKAAIDAGRFVVPFGAFASQSNPGVYRTVTRPLIYNMGQRVRDEDLGDPVLPMPYSDEGANLSFGRALIPGLRADWNGYVVNGLQADRDGINFDQSRDYVAFNTRPTWGTRATVSTQRLRLGASVLTGQSSPTGGFDNIPSTFFYKIYGYDATWQVPNTIRFQFEYARRVSDRAAPDPATDRVRDRTSGYYLEGEVWHPYYKRLSFISRYDAQDRVSQFAPPESSLGLSSFGIHRFTYGLNLNLKTAGLVMVNHESWFLPGGLSRLDVLGVRWAYTF